MDIKSTVSYMISDHIEKRKQTAAQPPEKKDYKKTGKVLLILGICIELLGVGLLANEFIISSNGIKTTGTIVEIKQKIGTGRQGTGYAPVYSFVDKTGVAYTVESIVVSPSRDNEVGDKIPVVYHESNPNKARVDNGFRWYGPFIAIFVGAIHIVSGLFVGALAKRQENSEYA